MVARLIEGVCRQLVVGNDPVKTEQLWRSAYGSDFTQCRDISMLGVLSGIDRACWDIVGKSAYELLGGQLHERLRSYTYSLSRPKR